MGRVTVYLDDETEALMEAAAKAAGMSRSRWVAMLIRERTGLAWPESIRRLAGAWADLPTEAVSEERVQEDRGE